MVEGGKVVGVAVGGGSAKVVMVERFGEVK